MNSFRRYLPFALILAAAFAARVGAAVWWQTRIPAEARFAFGDSESYWTLARAIARGEPYLYSDAVMFRTPGYPLLLAPLFAFGNEPSVFAARMVSVVCGTATVAAVMWLTRMNFGSPADLIAGGIAAVFPEAIAASVFVLSEAPFGLVMVLQLIATVAAIQANQSVRGGGWGLLAGVLAGIGTLVRPSWLLFTPFAIAWQLIFSQDRRLALRLGAMQMIGLCLVLSPWWMRNYSLAGRFVATSSEVGASLYDGLSAKADGSSEMSFKPTPPPTEPGTPLDVVARRELARDDQWKSASLAWAKDHPARVAELAAIKFLRMWNVWPNAAEFRSVTLRLIIAGTYVPLIGLALFGLIRFRSQPPVRVLAIPALYFTLLHMVFVSSIRYRLPPLLPLVAVAAAGLCVLFPPRRS